MMARRFAKPDAYTIGADGFALRINPGDQFQALMLLGLFERELVSCVRSYAKPGSVVIDCGANLGYISLHAARTIGQTGVVEAFECDPTIAGMLRDHAELNGAPINVRELAVWKESGPLDFHISEQPAWSSLQEGAVDEVSKTEVMAVTLDDHLAKHGIDPSRISLIKLDVEGAEPEALEGSRRLLREGSPILVIEIDPDRSLRLGKDPEGIFEQLADHGYLATEIVGRRSSDPRRDALHRPGPTDVVFARP
jgi:FkbM family methyltransferase